LAHQTHLFKYGSSAKKIYLYKIPIVHTLKTWESYLYMQTSLPVNPQNNLLFHMTSLLTCFRQPFEATCTTAALKSHYIACYPVALVYVIQLIFCVFKEFKVGSVTLH